MTSIDQIAQGSAKAKSDGFPGTGSSSSEIDTL